MKVHWCSEKLDMETELAFPLLSDYVLLSAIDWVALAELVVILLCDSQL